LQVYPLLPDATQSKTDVSVLLNINIPRRNISAYSEITYIEQNLSTVPVLCNFCNTSAKLAKYAMSSTIKNVALTDCGLHFRDY
jgi:hypothetical protein